jgi:hypothetical protein
MPAVGQFWGTLSPAPAGNSPPNSALLNQPTPNQFLLNIDAHRPLEPGLFVHQIPPGMSPLGDTVNFALKLQATTNDGRLLNAHGSEVWVVDSDTGRASIRDVAARNGIPYRLDIQAVASVQDSNYYGTWRNGWGESGDITFWRPEAGERVRDVTTCASWSDYKTWAGGVGRNNFAFRGQSNNQWQLKTSLHRSSRFDLWYYTHKTLPRLQEELEGAAGTSFDREKPVDFARLMALGQHHGFPTPLIDFTFSPYVAAYFALSGALDVAESSRASYVRIYALDKAFESVANNPLMAIKSIAPAAGILGISGLHNPRLYAQQGLFLFSNIALVEHLLTSSFYTHGATYLRAVDIPSDAAVEALTDLAYMGISPASLFPGIDGVCMKMKQLLLTGEL